MDPFLPNARTPRYKVFPDAPSGGNLPSNGGHMRKLKFMILISLFAASCMTANEKSSCEEKTITVHDTVKVAKVDTLRLHDTLTVTKRDTLKTLVHDTLRIHDTTRVITHDTILAGLPDPQNLFGVW